MPFAAVEFKEWEEVGRRVMEGSPVMELRGSGYRPVHGLQAVDRTPLLRSHTDQQYASNQTYASHFLMDSYG